MAAIASQRLPQSKVEVTVSKPEETERSSAYEGDSDYTGSTGDSGFMDIGKFRTSPLSPKPNKLLQNFPGESTTYTRLIPSTVNNVGYYKTTKKVEKVEGE